MRVADTTPAIVVRATIKSPSEDVRGILSTKIRWCTGADYEFA